MIPGVESIDVLPHPSYYLSVDSIARFRHSYRPDTGECEIDSSLSCFDTAKDQTEDVNLPHRGPSDQLQPFSFPKVGLHMWFLLCASCPAEERTYVVKSMQFDYTVNASCPHHLRICNFVSLILLMESNQ